MLSEHRLESCVAFYAPVNGAHDVLLETEEIAMRRQHGNSQIVSLALAAFVGGAALTGLMAGASPTDDGIVRSKSVYPFNETIERLSKDVAAKGIMTFLVIDQAKLAKDVGLSVIPSTLLVFGNPALGTQFVAARPQAGLDWPVRLLVQQDAKGDVWISYTDFGWIARRHRVEDNKAFATATGVIAAIASSVTRK
jgi:uncharacterized protein (DUF302 family)